MPSLLEIGSTDAVQFLYSRRTVVLVEGPGDKNAFEEIVGPGYEADIEFRVAPTPAGQGGCKAVRDRVPEMRAGNPRIFGLLDGEVAASVSATITLLDCTDTMFTVNGQDGLIFLGVHELENLYLQWSDVPSILADHTTAARMHLHPAPAIRQTLDGLISRFTRASLYKYTSAHFHRLGQMRNILNARIFGQGSFKTIRPVVVSAVTSSNGVTWSEFLAELANVRQAARTSYRRATSDPARRSWLLRIADGKELLYRLRQIHGNIGDSVEGSLLRAVCRSEYPERFRTALFDLTGTVPSTFAP